MAQQPAERKQPTPSPSQRTPAEDLQPADDGSAEAGSSNEKPDVSDREAPIERHEKGPKSGGMGPKQ